MALIRQVLLYSTLLLSVYGHPHERRLLHLFNPVNLLDAVARVTYPITSGINNAVGSLLNTRNHPPANDYYDPYERYPTYGSEPGVRRRGNIEAITKDVMDILLKIIRENRRDSNNPYFYDSLSEESDRSYSRTDSESSDFGHAGMDFISKTSSSLESRSLEANDPVSADTDNFENNANFQSALQKIFGDPNNLLNPGNVNPGDNQGVKNIGDGSPNTSGFNFGTSNLNNPIISSSSLTNDASTQLPSATSDVDIPTELPLANDTPSSSVPVNGSHEANDPADFVPSTTELEQTAPANSL